MNLAEVDRRLDRAGSFFRLRDFHAGMQFKAVVPDEGAGPSMLGKHKRHDQGWVPFAHGQDHAPTLHAHRLSRPVDGVKPFLAPGILHPHFGMLFAHTPCSLDVGEEGVNHHLYGLTVQPVAAFGGPLQVVAPRPRGMGQARYFVRLHKTLARGPPRFSRGGIASASMGYGANLFRVG
jgi:hypothetical protein